MNLAGFKKLKEDKKMVTMGHPMGHTITIAKNAVSALQRKQLERLPLHMADGGDPGDNSEDQAYSDRRESVSNVVNQGVDALKNAVVPSDDQKQKMADFYSNREKISGASSPDQQLPDANPNLPGAGTVVGAESSTPAPASIPSAKATTDATNLNASYQQGQRAITEQQDVASTLAQHNADIQQKDIQDRQDLADDAKQNAKDFQTHQKQVMNDYLNDHINPNHFQESMGTGQKVATAIGLLLGGFTGGFNKTGVNPAADWLNGQISKDIDAQKSRIDQQKTLLGANQDLYHDQVLADNATRINMNDIYDHKIQLEASKLGTPAAKAAADAQHAKFALDNASLLQQNAVRSATLQGLQKGNGAVNAIDLVNSGIIPKEYQGEALKEQSSLDAQKTAINGVRDLYSRLNKEQTAQNLVNPESSRRVGALNAELVNTVMNASASKRLTRESVEQEINPLKILTTDTDAVRNAKLQGVLNMVEKHADPTPLMKHYSPASLPQYQNATSQTPQYQVGDIVYVKGQKGQVLPDGRIKAVK